MSTLIPHLKKVTVLIVASVLLILAGCETPGTKPEEGAYTTSKSGIQRADEMIQAASSLSSPERDRLLLEAADIFLSENRTRKANSALNRIDETVLSQDENLLFTLLNGELALARKDPGSARQFIRNSEKNQNITGQAVALRMRWHRARGGVFTLTGEPTRSIYEFTRAASLLGVSNPGRQALHDEIWRILNDLPIEIINDSLTRSADETVAGWYQLGTLARAANEDITQLIQNIRDWQTGNPQHPAAQLAPTPLQRLTGLTVSNPGKIAVLLPHDGEFDQVTQTLTDGILSAYYARLGSGGSVPEIRFYDTNSAAITALYQQSVSEGADLVIGPLRREKLAELMGQAELPVPVLGLNYVEDTPNTHNNLYQFGLSMRDEAGQIAEQGWKLGYRTALLIVPQGRMGESANEGFRANWEDRGGKVIASTIYNSSDYDYTELLEPSLLIKQSSERATRLQRLLGKNLEFTPRRRGDVDMVVLVAYPDRGRQIKPALDFLYAGDLPVFSTSHIYGGVPNAELDQDLDEIIFTAMPWSMQAFSKGMISARKSLPVSYKNLFSMGVDTYKLHQWLELLKNLPDNDIRGQTGHLSMVEQNQVQRRLPWARFRNGVPVPALEMSVTETRAP